MTPHPPQLSIIIPTRDRYDLLDKALAAWEPQMRYAGSEIIIIDTNEVDSYGSHKNMNIETYHLPGASFAQAVNAGAKQARGEYLLLANDDVVPSAEFVSRAYLRAQPATITGYRLLYPNGLIQHAGVGFDIDGNPYHLWHNAPAEHPEAMKDRALPAVTFALAAIWRETWRIVGGLDEGYINGYEDLDFCLRAREMGFPVTYFPHPHAVHHACQSAGRFEHEAANKQRFYETWIASGRLSYVTGSWPFSVGAR